MSSNFVGTVKRLPLAERMEIVEALWESLSAEGYQPPLTPEQAGELDRRLEAHRLDPDDVVTWNMIEQSLLDRQS